MRLPLALVVMLALGPAAAADPIEIAYVVGTGIPGSGLVCFDASETTRAIEPPSVGGACTVRIPTGAPLVVEAIDDASGAQVSFFYDLRVGDPDAACARGFVTGPIAIDVPPACDQLSVHPAFGSLSGIVRIT